MIQNKASYMDDETWAKVVKVVYPGIRKAKVRNVACVFLFIIYKSNFPSLSLQILCISSVISQSGGHSSHIMASSIT